VKTSIALCSFNGERFVSKQLESIAAQDVPPGELVVCDDGSKDRTVEIVRRFARSARFPVRVEVNASTLGVAGNFEKALGLCTGDLIFLADQDDVWLPRKLASIVRQFEVRPDLGLVFSDAEAVDERGCPLRYRLWDGVGMSRRERHLAAEGDLFRVLLRRNVVTGATLAFRSEFRPLVLPIPRFWQHDAWIALLISAVASCKAIPDPLILYRQHATQVQGERVLSFYRQYQIAKREGAEKFALVAMRHTAASQRLATWDQAGRIEPAVRALRQKSEHFEAKISIRRARYSRLRMIARELVCGRYRRYSRGWKSLAQDLFL